MLTGFIPLEKEGPPVLDAALFVSLAMKDCAKNIGSVDLKDSNLGYSKFCRNVQDHSYISDMNTGGASKIFQGNIQRISQVLWLMSRAAHTTQHSMPLISAREGSRIPNELVG